MALIVVLLSMTLLAALGLALVLTTSTETRVAASYAWSAQTLYAADAAIERAVHDLSLVANWSDTLAGAAVSTFVDGAPGSRVLPDGTRLDLNRETDRLNCGHSPCSVVDLTTNTAERSWGANNPIWRLYVYGPITDPGARGANESAAYAIVWVSDDPLETDGQPLIDGDETAGANPGRGVLQLHAQAYGPAGAMRIVEITLQRVATRVRVLSWRELR
jgi:hypothetical protein